MKDVININSFNCRGLRDEKKRRAVFNWLYSKHSGIVLLQETHSKETDEQLWASEWGGQIFFSHGTNQSRGVAVLLPKNMKERCVITGIERDQSGRVLIIDCNIEDNLFTIFNVYAPTKDQYTEQQCFLEYLRELLQKHEEKNLILAGDFNTYLNCKLDKKGGSIESETKFSKGLKLLCEEYTLIDMWRASNPIERKYTWRDNTRAGVVQARLDYFLISQHLNYLISNCSFKPDYKSDHSLISLSIDLLDTHKRGKSYSKFNNSLLYDKTCVQLIKEELKILATDNTIKDKSSFWDFVKCKIRSLTISYSVTLAKRKRKQEEILFKKLESMENNLDLNTQEYNIVKREWENILRDRY